MEVCLFDVDGTLVDSSEPVLLALNKALSEVGLRGVTSGDLGHLVGPPLRRTLETVVTDRGGRVELTDRLIDRYRLEYRTLSIELAASYSGVATLLDELAGRTRLGVVTSKPAEYAIPILDALGFSPMMEVIEGPDLSETEAKPETLARALTRLETRVEPRSVAMIGDRRQDVEAGQSAGVGTIGVTWGFGTRQELLTAGADHVVDSPGQIKEIALATHCCVAPPK
ncbi:MAG: HAD family hydrolase [Acidimicrobiia bacterium]|nr:HAD family hydrolase [Acidimicrobiia bacterium]